MMMMKTTTTTTTTTPIIITIIIIISLKGAIRGFYNPPTAPLAVSNRYAQEASAQSCANHVQHIEQITCNTLSAFCVQHVVCHVVRRNS